MSSSPALSPAPPSYPPVQTSIAPEYFVYDPWEGTNGSTATLRHLASHMAGLGRDTPPFNTTAEALAGIASTDGMAAPAGARPQYSNPGHALLGHLLVRAAAAPRAWRRGIRKSRCRRLSACSRRTTGRRSMRGSSAPSGSSRLGSTTRRLGSRGASRPATMPPSSPRCPLAPWGTMDPRAAHTAQLLISTLSSKRSRGPPRER